LVAATTFGVASPLAKAQRVSPGITVLLADSAHLIRGKRVGLVTNHTGRDERGRSSIDLIHSARGVKLVALFSPEHGIRGTISGGERISSGVDETTGVPIYSLYGKTMTPTPQMLKSIDVLVYDIQDVGARAYTYVWTMTLAAEAAKKSGVKFIVLDRPNPIRADVIEGGSIEKRYRSLTGLHNVPIRYGMTAGELARVLSAKGAIEAEVIVVPMKGYRRSMLWNETGLEWINPSPNIRRVEAALLYPGIGFFEATNLSEGRGTDAPLEQVGASWMSDAPAIASAMNAKRLPGIRFTAVKRRVARGEKFGSQTIPMINVRITNPDSVRSVTVGAMLLREIYRRHPRDFLWEEEGIERLSGSRALRHAVEGGGVETLIAKWKAESDAFRAEASHYYMYPP
jgi:uncharacterized protein YbbC (DUF1343 family)